MVLIGSYFCPTTQQTSPSPDTCSSIKSIFRLNLYLLPLLLFLLLTLLVSICLYRLRHRERVLFMHSSFSSVEYVDPYLADLATLPLLKWVPVFEDYLIPDSPSAFSSSSSSSSCYQPTLDTNVSTASTTSTTVPLTTAAAPSSHSSSSIASASYSSDSTSTTNTNDSSRRHAIQGISRYKVRNNKVLFSFAGDLLMGELDHASTH